MARQNKYDQAIQAFDRGLAIDPGRMDFFGAKIKTLVVMGKADKAIAGCKERLGDSPDDAFLHNLLGEVYLVQKVYGKAIEAFKRAIDLAPSSMKPYTNLARTYSAQGKTDEAIKQIEDRFKESPEAIHLAFLLGLLYEIKNERQKAIASYRQVVEEKPGFILAVNNLAFLIAEEGGTGKEMDEALELALKATNRFPDEPHIVDTLGWVYYRRGEYEKAYGQFQKLLEKGVDNPIFNYHLGMVLYKQGRKAQAKDRLQKALEKPSAYVDEKAVEEVLKELD